jgi:hypothetical protein
VRAQDYMVVANIDGVMRVIGLRAMDAGERQAVEHMLSRRFMAQEVIPPSKPVVKTAPINPPTAHSTLTQGEIAREQGFTGNPCQQCGGLRLKRSGTCETCQDCGWNAGCG